MTLRIQGHLRREGGERLQAHWLWEMAGCPRSPLLAKEQLLTTSRSPPLEQVQRVKAHSPCRP